mgnify:CR=1 FL=1
MDKRESFIYEIQYTKSAENEEVYEDWFLFSPGMRVIPLEDYYSIRKEDTTTKSIHRTL